MSKALSEAVSLLQAWSGSFDESAQLPVFDKLPLGIVRGEGCRVWDADGRDYWDLYGGHAVSLVGHAHPLWVEVLAEQARRLPFYSNLTPHPLRAAACRAIVDLAPPNFSHVFLTNSGAEANETALKLARRHTGRADVVAFSGGFHGRTLATLAVTSNAKYRNYAQPGYGHTRFVPNSTVPLLDESVAAVIIEPIQSLNGMHTFTTAFLTALRAECDRVGALLIFDEVQTAWGRLGVPFAAEFHAVRADLITGAKSAAGGFPVGVTIVDHAIAEQVHTGDQGSTFGAGPLACAAILVTQEIVRREGLMQNARAVEGRLRERCALPVFGHGCLLGVQTPVPVKVVLPKLRERGYLVGGSDVPDVMRLMPPLSLPLDVIDSFVDALTWSLE